jgi:hypothetical protein
LCPKNQDHFSQPAAAFDLPLLREESFSCLVLEMWASEVYRKYSREKKTGQTEFNPEQLAHKRDLSLLPILFGRFTKRSWSRSDTQGLIGLLAEPDGRSLKTAFAKAMASGTLPRLYRHSLELFKATLLLREIFNLQTLVDPSDLWRLNARAAQPNAVSVRHWFSSAVDALSNISENLNLIPMRLPGHFAVRGDWYLGVAQGSQSYLLADRALDLLTSRRGNIERMQRGIGLPSRKISNDGSIRTPLFTLDRNERQDWIRYGELLSLGSLDTKSSKEKEELSWNDKEDFHWLWRSSLGDYDAQSRTFQRGLSWIMHWWYNLIPVRGTGWISGFHLYDALERYESCRDQGDTAGMKTIFDEHFDVRSLWEFPEMVDSIVSGLRRSTPRKSAE